MKRTTKRFGEKQRKNLFFPIFIAIILVSSILGFIWKDQGSTDIKEYNGYKFTKTEKGWVTQIGEKQVFFDYYPAEIEDIVFPSLSRDVSKIYIAFNPEQKDTNIGYILQKTSDSLSNAGIKPVFACIKDSPECPDIPIINCENNDLVIQILKADEAKIFKQDNCIILEGNSAYLNKAIDKLKLNLLVS
tara:strand:+ start:191 stop:757 length:567 start_codon:yes stop_codon:yes gene_type:complete